MSITLYYHPLSRAANVVWMLEEVGVPYQRCFVDLATNEHKRPEFLALNPMGKLPVLTDDEAVVTETAAIALYLADRYASGRLAPAFDDPRRGTYLRWSFFSPSVIEPGFMAKAAGWDYQESHAGWGNHSSMLAAMQSAVRDRDFLLGADFSMADVVFGGTVGYLLEFGLLEPLPVLTAYRERLRERPALQRATAINEKERARISPPR